MSVQCGSLRLVLSAVLCAVGAGPVSGQALDTLGLAPLFADDEPLPLTITADVGALRGDRRESPDRPAVFTVPTVGSEPRLGAAAEVSGEVRTRGAFRLDPANCSFPPLRLEVAAGAGAGTALEGQDDLKLVSSCRPGRASYDELVTLEYLVYRTYALVTDLSFRTRRIVMTLVDSRSEAEDATRPGFLIEENDALARRTGATVFELEEGRILPSWGLEPRSMMTTAVFQYMVGNSDWSDVAGHNVELLERAGAALVVPYDFDFTGVVDAPYAVPPAMFGLSSVRERIYRGWCATPLVTTMTLDRFRAVEAAVMSLWTGSEALNDDTRRRAVAYLEEFFDAIETDERAERVFLRDCRRQEG
jgi:hypothetical protein